MDNAITDNPLFDRVERGRRRKHKIRETHITLAHGSGGRAMHDLVEGVFLEHFHNPLLDKLEDQAVFEVNGYRRLAFTTDSYVVDPIFFPGGDIGELAIYGTVNDLAVSGAVPLYLSAGFMIEEGFPIEDLRRIVISMKNAADRAGVQIVTGDTKVVQKGAVDKLFINTAGVGGLEGDQQISAARARPGDKVIVSGTIGDHGTTIMIARGELALETDIRSDTAPLNTLIADMLDEAKRLGRLDEVRSLRDPTRGGVATTLNEIALSSDVCIEMNESDIPVLEEVKGACEILGLDPLYVANEGKLIAIVGPGIADEILGRMRQNEIGTNAAIFGTVTAEPPGIVVMKTGFGGTRIVDMLAGEQLPRIC